MSATIDSEQLSKLLDAPVIQSKGRQYPVEVNYLLEVDEYAIGEDAARQIIPLTKQHPGDFLVFLPGQGEIRKAEEVLKLKRTKPLKAWESTLDACINLKVRSN